MADKESYSGLKKRELQHKFTRSPRSRIIGIFERRKKKSLIPVQNEKSLIGGEFISRLNTMKRIAYNFGSFSRSTGSDPVSGVCIVYASVVLYVMECPSEFAFRFHEFCITEAVDNLVNIPVLVCQVDDVEALFHEVSLIILDTPLKSIEANPKVGDTAAFQRVIRKTYSLASTLKAHHLDEYLLNGITLRPSNPPSSPSKNSRTSDYVDDVESTTDKRSVKRQYENDNRSLFYSVGAISPNISRAAHECSSVNRSFRSTGRIKPFYSEGNLCKSRASGTTRSGTNMKWYKLGPGDSAFPLLPSQIDIIALHESGDYEKLDKVVEFQRNFIRDNQVEYGTLAHMRTVAVTALYRDEKVMKILEPTLRTVN